MEHQARCRIGGWCVEMYDEIKKYTGTHDEILNLISQFVVARDMLPFDFKHMWS